MTIFAKIIAGEIPADIVLEDEHVLAFRDISPQAPVHVLVIPKRPLVSLHDASEEDTELLGRCLQVCRAVAEREGLGPAGYRVVTNIGLHGGQSVPHLHFHVLGGRGMSWPPG